jgi:hypothetical protein
MTGDPLFDEILAALRDVQSESRLAARTQFSELREANVRRCWEDDVGIEDDPEGPIHVYPVFPDEPKHELLGQSCWCSPEVRGWGKMEKYVVVHRRTQ